MPANERLSFRGRVVVVTGAGSGLGRAYALALAAREAQVVVNGRRNENVQETVEQIHAAGGAAVASVADVGAAGAGVAVVETALATWGRLDALVNNAGVGHMSSADDFSSDAFDADLQVSLRGSLALSLAAWPHLKEGGSGRIVNTSSSSIFGIPHSIPYATAKAALLGLTQALAQDGAAARIRVNAVMPLAATEMNANLPDPELVKMFQDHFPVEEAAALVLLLCHERAPGSGETYITGGGFTGRVGLVVSQGIREPGAGPEGILEKIDRVRDLAGGHAPRSSGDARRFIVERLQS